MSLSTQDLDWEIVMQSVSKKETHLPELGGRISDLFGLLRTVKSLHAGERMPDRRLFGLDLENLAQGVDMLASLRSSGVQDERIQTGISDLSALISDMMRRGRDLVDAKLKTALIHTSVSSLGLSNSPLPENAPMNAVLLTDADTKPSDGRRALPVRRMMDGAALSAAVSGEILYGEVTQEKRFDHVSPHLFYLPAGRVLTLEPDESVVLWEGKEGDSSFDVLKGRAFRIETQGETVSIHGPVFVSQCKDGSDVLRRNNAFKLHASRTSERNPSQGMMTVVGGLMMVFIPNSVIIMATAMKADPRNVSNGQIAQSVQQLNETMTNMFDMLATGMSFFGICLVVCGICQITGVSGWSTIRDRLTKRRARRYGILPMTQVRVDPEKTRIPTRAVFY